MFTATILTNQAIVCSLFAARLTSLFSVGSFPKTELTAAILAQGDAYLARQKEERSARPTVFAALTAREYEIVCLAAERLSNREIAERLYLTEGSVKQYVTKIYAKLGLTGDSRAKRAALADMLFPKH